MNAKIGFFLSALTIGGGGPVAAQRSIDVSFGSAHMYRVLNLRENIPGGPEYNRPVLLARNQRESPRIGWHAAVYYNQPLGTSWRLRTGLAWSQYGYTADRATPYWGPAEPCDCFEPPADVSFKISNVFSLLELPLLLRYEKQPARFGFFFEGGLAPAWVAATSARYLDPSPMYQIPLARRDYLHLRRAHLLLKLGAGVQFHPWQRWQLFVQPNASLALTSALGGDKTVYRYQERWTAVSLDVGARYLLPGKSL
jgi:hypothetical protein